MRNLVVGALVGVVIGAAGGWYAAADRPAPTDRGTSGVGTNADHEADLYSDVRPPVPPRLSSSASPRP